MRKNTTIVSTKSNLSVFHVPFIYLNEEKTTKHIYTCLNCESSRNGNGEE